MRGLAELTAVAAHLVAEHAEVLGPVCNVSSRTYATDQGEVSMQIGHHSSWEADLVAVARAAGALGISHVELIPFEDYVKVRAVAEIKTAVGAARVEVWDHLPSWRVAELAAERLGVALTPDTDPVFVAAGHVLSVCAAVA